MNFLAHAYLSFGRPGILTGNMISDFVKGKKQYDYPASIQTGIRLHRAIDTFTDSHTATKKLNDFFKPAYRLYSGVFTDVVYDYFLANDKSEFPVLKDLEDFADRSYKALGDDFHWLPDRFAKIFPYMKSQNWLLNYRHKWLIEKSFTGLARRAVYLTESQTAFTVFNANTSSMQSCYDEFFPQLKSFAIHKLQELLNN